jgi:hypothetical protein
MSSHVFSADEEDRIEAGEAMRFINLGEYLEWIYAHGVPGPREFGSLQRKVERLSAAKLEAWSILLAGEKVIGFAFVVMDKGIPFAVRNGYEADVAETIKYVTGVRQVRSKQPSELLQRAIFAKKV